MLDPVVAMGQHRLQRVEQLHLGIDRKAQRFEVGERLAVTGQNRPALHLRQLIGPEQQPPLGGDRRIFLT